MMAAAELDDVTKVFRIRRNRALNLKVRALGLWHARHREHVEEFRALSNVSVRVDKGEILGVIGPNGSGKSTLLRLVAGILRPTSGEVRTRGRVVPLIELGVGFQPDLSGRENIYLNTSLFGLSREQTDALYPRIVEFSGVGDFIDVAVKNYSSGMFMRLGFAIAAHLDADVLLLDEILSVGDAAFQAKCMERLREFRSAGRTIVIVSHSLAEVESLCTRACLLMGGRLVAEGRPDAIVARYRDGLAASPPTGSADA